MKRLFFLSFLISTVAFADDHELASSESIMISELSVEQFRSVATTIVQEVLENCSVEGDMEGKAKLNFRVVGEVTAKMVCDTESVE